MPSKMILKDDIKNRLTGENFSLIRQNSLYNHTGQR